jgi:methionine-rich copper-binding protein CopC
MTRRAKSRCVSGEAGTQIQFRHRADLAGKQVDKGGAAVDKVDRMVIRVSLPPLEPGVYKVEWKAVSADTHRVSGDFTFKVGE